uniref:Uncharacterized protein n=1 Tax=Leersia perrieri TaxID=77586 RepID=A0A0D9XKN6_9ORYZ
MHYLHVYIQTKATITHKRRENKACPTVHLFPSSEEQIKQNAKRVMLLIFSNILIFRRMTRMRISCFQLYNPPYEYNKNEAKRHRDSHSTYVCMTFRINVFLP